MPLQVKTLKSALFHLANLSVSRPIPVSINRPELGETAPGRWHSSCSTDDENDPAARFGFFVDFDGVAVSCMVDGLTRAEMAQVHAAYDLNVETLLPHALKVMGIRADIQEARKAVSNDIDVVRRDLQEHYYGTAKRDGTSLDEAGVKFRAALDALNLEDMPSWPRVEAAQQHMFDTLACAQPGLVDAPNWIDYLNKSKRADAIR